MTKTLQTTSCDRAEEAVVAALAAEGFGVLTRIDVQATLHAKLGTEIKPYRILGACNPKLAEQALAVDSQMGLLLPCNVVVQELDGQVVVSIFDPLVMLRLGTDDGIKPIAREAALRLDRVLTALS
jgi:uncharacterized protein (DUF302 family)